MAHLRFHRYACLIGWAVSLAGAVLIRAQSSTLREGRIMQRFDGIECEYSPGQEALARMFSARIAQYNATRHPQSRPELPAGTPLTPLDLRTNRSQYLDRIARMLALPKPTALQEECFDAFLNNYEACLHLQEQIYDQTIALRFTRIALWSRSELAFRLESGERIPGMSWDPKTRSGKATFLANIASGPDAQLRELAQRRKSMRINSSLGFTISNGVSRYRGHASWGGDSKRAISASAAAPDMPVDSSPVFPIIIKEELDGESDAELVDRMCAPDTSGSFEAIYRSLETMGASWRKVDVNLAFLVLHETVEVGVVDHFLASKERRWFCDGVANYVAWRTIQDMYGLTAAAEAYNLQQQRMRYASLVPRVDLLKWSVSEQRDNEEKDADLTLAHYTFATQAVALMHERYGEDILARLFGELGRTPRSKASMKTVDRSFRKITNAPLSSVIKDATLPTKSSL